MKCCDSLEKLRELENFILRSSPYIEEKIKHLDSDIRMRVMSDFDKSNASELKTFLEKLNSFINQ
jgi:hypothetical protein